jgi:4-carboxymuconolactone decarboxylase
MSLHLAWRLYNCTIAADGDAPTIDLIGLCGYYGTLAMVLNTARIPLPDDAQPFEP